MELNSSGRKFSFEILSSHDLFEHEDYSLDRSKSDSSVIRNGYIRSPDHHSDQDKRRRKKKSSKKKKKTIGPPIPEPQVINNDSDDSRVSYAEKDCRVEVLDTNLHNYSIQSVVFQECSILEVPKSCGSVHQIIGADPQSKYSDGAELRQRNNSIREVENLVQSTEFQGIMANGRVMSSLETASLDWNGLTTEDPTHFSSPMKYFLDEIYGENSLHSTTTLGNEKEREQVYDTIFRLPWRCELLIDIGFLVCLDSFLSLLTIMPTRLLMTFWRCVSRRKLRWLSTAELCDFASFFVLISGVMLLEQTDVSLIYHMIRGQGTVKLYVVYNVLEILDKLFQGFTGEVMQSLFNSADGLANCRSENRPTWCRRFASDQSLAVAVSIVHSFTLLVQAITLSTCIVAHNNALFALLVSNNFAEIKSSVFKRFNRDNIHGLAYLDSVERFHILSFLLFVLAQNILEAEGPWFRSFLWNAALVFVCEIAIDIIKHSFLAKFNNVKPTAYSDFLEQLCRQTLRIETDHRGENGRRRLTFVPLAPACVVIRVVAPVYGAYLPHAPLPSSRLLSVPALCAATYAVLLSLKMLVGLTLRKHAIWYIHRRESNRKHVHDD